MSSWQWNRASASAIVVAMLLGGCAVDAEMLARIAAQSEKVGRMLDEAEPHAPYEGSKRPASELAQIAIIGKAGIFNVSSVDGKARAWSAWDSKAFVYVTPGVHKVELQYKAGGGPVLSTITFSEPIAIEFLARAGHTYQPDFEYSNSARSAIRGRMVDLGANFPRRCTVLSSGHGIDSPQVRRCVDPSSP